MVAPLLKAEETCSGARWCVFLRRSIPTEAGQIAIELLKLKKPARWPGHRSRSAAISLSAGARLIGEIADQHPFLIPVA